MQFLNARFFIPLTFIVACGASPADVPDPSPDASCACPSPQLNTSTVHHVPWETNFQPRNRLGIGAGCDEGDLSIGGSCTYYGTDPRMYMTIAGDVANPDRPNSWACGWYNATEEWQDVTTTVICLGPEVASSTPEGCDCPDYEPIVDRIIHNVRSEPFRGYTTNEITIECPDGGVMLGGGCADQWPDVQSAVQFMTLSRSGFTTEDATTWRCGWNTPVQTDTEMMRATAYCLQPPSYGPDLLEGRVNRVIESQTITAGGYASFTAACAPRDYLLSGSCMVDSADPVSHQAIMYHHGLDATDPTAWRCAWDNPTALNLPATIIATCVSPPSD